LLDIREHAIFADYFVICEGTSDRMLGALQDALRDEIRKDFGLHPRLEGEPREGWVLVDYGDVVVHLFSPEKRDYYRLEELWSQGKILLHLQ
jgi:ribosome-associated protein